LLERRGFTSSEYFKILKEQDIKLGDIVVLVDVEKKVQLARIMDTSLLKDEDGDEYFKILTNEGVFNCYLQGLTSFRKGR
jgi:ribosomal protein L15